MCCTLALFTRRLAGTTRSWTTAEEAGGGEEKIKKKSADECADVRIEMEFLLVCVRSCSAAQRRRGRSIHPGPPPPTPPPGCGSVGNCTQTLINDGTCGGITMKVALTLTGTVARQGCQRGVGGASCVGVYAGHFTLITYFHSHFCCVLAQRSNDLILVFFHFH